MLENKMVKEFALNEMKKRGCNHVYFELNSETLEEYIAYFKGCDSCNRYKLKKIQLKVVNWADDNQHHVKGQFIDGIYDGVLLVIINYSKSEPKLIYYISKDELKPKIFYPDIPIPLIDAQHKTIHYNKNLINLKEFSKYKKTFDKNFYKQWDMM